MADDSDSAAAASAAGEDFDGPVNMEQLSRLLHRSSTGQIRVRLLQPTADLSVTHLLVVIIIDR